VSKAIFPALVVLAIVCSQIGATPATPHKRRHTVKASSTTAGKHTSAATKTAATKATRTHTKAAYRRKGKAYRAVSYSYQQVPTPERYKEIQAALASKGYFHGDANGEWGADSTDALKRFQADQSLMPDGKINSLSLIALGLGPKRLTAKSEPVPPVQAAAPDASPGATSPPAGAVPHPR